MDWNFNEFIEPDGHGGIMDEDLGLFSVDFSNRSQQQQQSYQQHQQQQYNNNNYYQQQTQQQQQQQQYQQFGHERQLQQQNYYQQVIPMIRIEPQQQVQQQPQQQQQPQVQQQQQSFISAPNILSFVTPLISSQLQPTPNNNNNQNNQNNYFQLLEPPVYRDEPTVTVMSNQPLFSLPTKLENLETEEEDSNDEDKVVPGLGVSRQQLLRTLPNNVRVNNPPPMPIPIPQPVLSEFSMIIDPQPPVEVRTRTPSEMRVFAIGLRFEGDWKSRHIASVHATLCYAVNTSNPTGEEVRKDILGGSTVVNVSDSTPHLLMDNLCISESSAKHKEREFCVELVAYNRLGQEVMRKRTNSFYAYSHKKVLQRRGSTKLRCLSKTWGRVSGGEVLHIIGSPFLQSPALRIIVRTAHGEVAVKPTEYFSDSVLFFELPSYPLTTSNDASFFGRNTELPAQILVTNDGRTFSNHLDFTYVIDPKSRF